MPNTIKVIAIRVTQASGLAILIAVLVSVIYSLSQSAWWWLVFAGPLLAVVIIATTFWWLGRRRNRGAAQSRMETARVWANNNKSLLLPVTAVAVVGLFAWFYLPNHILTSAVFWILLLLLAAGLISPKTSGVDGVVTTSTTKRVIRLALVGIALVVGLGTFLESKIGNRATKAYEQVVKCLEGDQCPKDGLTTPSTRVVVPEQRRSRPALPYETMVAPAKDWSDYRTYTTGHCFRIWSDNLEADDFRAKVLYENGDEMVYSNGTYASETVGFSVKSNIGRPIRVQYELWDKEPGKRCKMS